MADQLGNMRNGQKGRGVLTAWIERGEIYIRESLDRGRDVQTVCLTRKELEKILTLREDVQKEIAG